MIRVNILLVMFAFFLGYIGGNLLDRGEGGWLFVGLGLLLAWFSIDRIDPPVGV